MTTVTISPEFVALCEAQLRSLTQLVEGTSAAIYLSGLSGFSDGGATPLEYHTQARGGSDSSFAPHFVPVISYPESVEHWVETVERQSTGDTSRRPQRALPQATPSSSATQMAASHKPLSPKPLSVSNVQGSQPASVPNSHSSSSQGNMLAATENWSDLDHQVVVPLVYADRVVGLLVSVRRDRPLTETDRRQIENLAPPLAAGLVLEQRNQWLQAKVQHKRDLQGQQSEIFHNLLHQFRNPLTAVNTFGQLLVRKLDNEDPNQKLATGIVRESRRLREMVSHFDQTVAIGDADLASEQPYPPLLPAAAESTASVPNSLDSEAAEYMTEQAVDAAQETSDLDLGHGLGHSLTLSSRYLPEILEPILAVAEITAAQKDLTLRVQIAPDTPLVWGDEEAIGEVVSNLIDNAIKYSPDGATLWVQTGVSKLDNLGQYQGIVVADTGPGIPAEDIVHLFERSYRGVQADSEIPGTGLGLAIARELMDEMHGLIEVISPASGTVWLPEELWEHGPGTVFILWLQEVTRMLPGSM